MPVIVGLRLGVAKLDLGHRLELPWCFDCEAKVLSCTDMIDRIAFARSCCCGEPARPISPRLALG